MRRLSIYDLECDKKPVSTLEVGEYVFGRGGLLKCTDRRVSRNHGVIKITEDAVTITSTHQNPCFYQAANSTTITILPRDNAVDINDGDKFALLADKYWFRIKLESVLLNGNSDIKKNGKISSITELTGSYNKINDVIEENDNNSSSESIDLLQTNQKRSHEDEMETPDLKRTKCNDDETAGENQLLLILNDLRSEKDEDDKDQIVGCQTDTKKEKVSDSEEETNDVKTNKTDTKKEEMSESDDEIDNVDEKKFATREEQKVLAPKKRQVKNKATTSQSPDDADLKAMLFSSDEEEEIIEAGVKNGDDNSSIYQQSSNEEAERKTVEDNSNAASTSTKKKQHRDKCWYGSNCYRRSSAHFAELSHPGDTDYSPDPGNDVNQNDDVSQDDDKRPICMYGAECYRRSQDHRRDYRHLNKDQKPPAKRGYNKKTDAADTGADKKKRTARKQYNESSEDDYDIEDPFINDSSGSDYQVSSSEEDDSDSNCSAASEEKPTRLLKEAKKFMKEKKEDKNDD